MGPTEKSFMDDVKNQVEKINRSLEQKNEKNRPFPYWPPEVSNDELKRGEVMMELNKWANNDQEIAKRTASTLIILLAKQFEIDLKDIK